MCNKAILTLLVVFFGMVSFMTVAKPFESLVATAAWVVIACTSKGEVDMCKIDRYAAVLIVFLQISF
jgi:hypothetical protein